MSGATQSTWRAMKRGTFVGGEPRRTLEHLAPMTSTFGTPKSGPACPVVWDGSGDNYVAAPYSDLMRGEVRFALESRRQSGRLRYGYCATSITFVPAILSPKRRPSGSVITSTASTSEMRPPIMKIGIETR